MTRVALMQPYLFPYLGYWQLMDAVEVFVVYDTVQYSAGGWINRNRIRYPDAVRWLTVPVARGASHQAIGRQRLAPGFARQRDRMLRALATAYRTAPHRDRGLDLAERGLSAGADGAPLLELLLHTLECTRELLGIRAQLRLASGLEHDRSLGREDRVIALSLAAGGTEYLSLSGGRELYSAERFTAQGLRLRFREFDAEREGGEGELALSILDLVMRYDLPELRALLAAARWAEQ